MNHSLSIVLPVHNAQNSLARRIEGLFEVLPELTSRFEILVVDDASTDQTEEVAHELACRYPQLRVARHSLRQGVRGAVRTGLNRALGEIIIVQEENSRISNEELSRLWKLRNDQRLVMARSASQVRPLDNQLVERLAEWGAALCKNQTVEVSDGLQMIRRSAVEEMPLLDDEGAAPSGPAVIIDRRFAHTANIS